MPILIAFQFLFKCFGRRSRGQTSAEYAIVLGMITIGIVAAFAALNEGVRAALTAAAGSI